MNPFTITLLVAVHLLYSCNAMSAIVSTVPGMEISIMGSLGHLPTEVKYLTENGSDFLSSLYTNAYGKVECSMQKSISSDELYVSFTGSSYSFVANGEDIRCASTGAFAFTSDEDFTLTYSGQIANFGFGEDNYGSWMRIVQLFENGNNIDVVLNSTGDLLPDDFGGVLNLPAGRYYIDASTLSWNMSRGGEDWNHIQGSFLLEISIPEPSTPLIAFFGLCAILSPLRIRNTRK